MTQTFILICAIVSLIAGPVFAQVPSVNTGSPAINLKSSDAATANPFQTARRGNTVATKATASPEALGQAKRATDAINIEDYGAVGDGSTDNSGAVSSAIAACISVGGCTLYFGSASGGQFALHGVQIAASNVRVVCGGGVSIINDSTDTYALQFGDGWTQYHNDEIRGCTFGEQFRMTATTGNIALALTDLLEMNVVDIAIKAYPAAPYVGLHATNINQSVIDKIYVAGMLNAGVQIVGSGATSGGDVFLTNAQSNSNGTDGYDLTDDGGFYAVNATAYGNASSAWNLYRTSYGNLNFLFLNCIGDTSGSYNWAITSLNNGQFNNVWGSTQKSSSLNTYATGFFLAGSGVKNIVMTNVTAVYNNSHGIEINGSGGMPQNISIVNPIAGSTTNGNGRSGAGFGIDVDNHASSISIVGGMALNNASGSLSLGRGATVYVNAVQGYSTPLVSCSGSPTAQFAVDHGTVTHC
jgi:hypothetical protein